MRARRLPWGLRGILLLLLSAVGCFRLSRNTPPVMQYALAGAPLEPASSATPRGGRGFTVGLRRADVAAYLAVPDIIVRRGAHRIATSEFQRWSEPLDQSINRVVAASLVSSGAVRNVDLAPWPVRAAHDVLVQLHVARFEGVAAEGANTGEIHVEIAWDLVRPSTGRLLVRGTTDERSGATWPVNDIPALVRGLEAALGVVARDIGACIRAFPNDSTPPSTCGRTVGAR